MSQPAIEYYEQMAKVLLPFFQDRKAFIRQEIRGQTIFRRYIAKKSDIRIRSEEDILKWVRWNAIAFFGTLERDDGTIDFVVDVDRHELSLKLAALAAQQLYQIFQDYGLKPAVNFSGGGGFHFWLNFKSLQNREKSYVFHFHRKIVDLLQRKLEERIQSSKLSKEFYREVPKRLAIITSVTKEKAGKQIVLDRATNRMNGCIRAPYSLHDNGKYVCLPLSEEELMHFDTALVTKEAAVEKYQKKGYEFKVPTVEAKELIQEVEKHWGSLHG
jgi:DNA primase